jgi:hypothetical protein
MDIQVARFLLPLLPCVILPFLLHRAHEKHFKVQQAFLRWEAGVAPPDGAFPSFSKDTSGSLTELWYDMNVRAHMNDSRSCVDLDAKARAYLGSSKSEEASLPTIAAQPARSGLYGVPLLGAARSPATSSSPFATFDSPATHSTAPSTFFSSPASATPVSSFGITQELCVSFPVLSRWYLRSNLKASQIFRL